MDRGDRDCDVGRRTRRPHRLQAVECRPTPLVDAGLAAVGRGDHAAARRAMRDLRTAGATDASFVVQAAILVAKGHPIPALDVLPQTAVADWREAAAAVATDAPTSTNGPPARSQEAD